MRSTTSATAGRFSLTGRACSQLAGAVLFTDPLTVTGMLGSDEIATRTSIGYGLLVPLGENERLLAEAGLNVVTVEEQPSARRG
jgi:hypothetical protein